MKSKGHLLCHVVLCLALVAIAKALPKTGESSSAPVDTEDQDYCPSGWVKSTSGTCVKLYDDNKSWEDARATCKEDEADLVTILDDSMNNFIWELIVSSKRQAHWLGLHDRVGEDDHHWLDGTDELTFTRWHEGQPNDGRGWNEDCVEMGGWVSTEKRKWNDADCSRRLKFFCEKSQIESSRGESSSAPVDTADQDYCPSGWVKSTSGTCVKLYDDNKSWEDARATCKEDGADLVTILDESMNNFIWELIVSSKRQAHWLGLHDRVGEDDHHWLDGTDELTFTRWHEGQPNDGRSWNQDCVEMGGWVSTEKRKWNDADCSRRLKFFCEKSQIESSRGKPPVVSTANPDPTTASGGKKLQQDGREVEDTTTTTDSDPRLDDQGVEETNSLTTIIQNSSGGNDLGAGAVAGIVIAMLVACVALVGAAILGRRFYLDRQPNKSSNMDSSKEFTNSNNIAYDPMNDFITDSNGYFNSSEA